MICEIGELHSVCAFWLENNTFDSEDFEFVENFWIVSWHHTCKKVCSSTVSFFLPFSCIAVIQKVFINIFLYRPVFFTASKYTKLRWLLKWECMLCLWYPWVSSLISPQSHTQLGYYSQQCLGEHALMGITLGFLHAKNVLQLLSYFFSPLVFLLNDFFCNLNICL